LSCEKVGVLEHPEATEEPKDQNLVDLSDSMAVGVLLLECQAYVFYVEKRVRRFHEKQSQINKVTHLLEVNI
jgi:hypothetical protein